MDRRYRRTSLRRFPPSRFIVAVVSVLLVAAVVPEWPANTSPQGVSLPARLPSDTDPDQYLWIAASEMFAATGAITTDLTLFPEHWRSGFADAIRSEYEAQRAGERPVSCVKLRTFVDRAPTAAGHFSNFDTLVAQSSGFIRGTVVSSAGGFLKGAPGVMLEVAVKNARFRGRARPGHQTTYVFFPSGRVPFGVTALCPGLSVHWPPDPGIGAEILVVLDRAQQPVHRMPPIYSLDTRGHELIYEEDGRMFSSSRLWALDGIRMVRSLDAVFAAATGAFARSNQ